MRARRAVNAPHQDGIRSSSSKSGAQAFKDERTRYACDFALDELTVPALGGFEPSTLDIWVGRGVKLRDERAEKLDLLFDAERADFLLDVFYSPSHLVTSKRF